MGTDAAKPTVTVKTIVRKFIGDPSPEECACGEAVETVETIETMPLSEWLSSHSEGED